MFSDFSPASLLTESGSIGLLSNIPWTESEHLYRICFKTICAYLAGELQTHPQTHYLLKVIAISAEVQNTNEWLNQ